MKRAFPLLAGTALLASLNGLAWGPTGHRATAELAQNHLNPQPANTCSIFLRGFTLADVANWADDMRDEPGYKVLEPLHYTDFPAGVKRYQDTTPPPEGDVVVAIKVLTQYLKTGNADVLKSVPAFTQMPVPMSQEIALKLLVHFVADVHQPMHVALTGTHGGATTHVLWMGHERSNLHVVWDELMIDATKLSYTELARYLDHLTPDERKAIEQDMDPADWANESYALHQQVEQFPDDADAGANANADGGKGGQNGDTHIVSYKYISQNRELLHQQLLKGGVRLAFLLNSIFPTADGGKP